MNNKKIDPNAKTTKFNERYYQPRIELTPRGWEASARGDLVHLIDQTVDPKANHVNIGTYETAGLAGAAINLLLERFGAWAFGLRNLGGFSAINDQIDDDRAEYEEFKRRLLAGELDEQLADYYGRDKSEVPRE